MKLFPKKTGKKFTPNSKFSLQNQNLNNNNNIIINNNNNNSFINVRAKQFSGTKTKPCVLFKNKTTGCKSINPHGGAKILHSVFVEHQKNRCVPIHPAGISSTDHLPRFDNTKRSFSLQTHTSRRPLSPMQHKTPTNTINNSTTGLAQGGSLSISSKRISLSSALSQILTQKLRQTGLSVRTDISYKYSKKKPTRAHEEPDFVYPTNQEEDYSIVPGETLEFDNAKTRLVLNYDILMTDAAMGPDAIMPWESAKARFVNGLAFWLPFFLLFGVLILYDPLSNQTWAPQEKPFHYLRNDYGNEPIYIEEGYPENEGFASVREKIKEKRISELNE